MINWIKYDMYSFVFYYFGVPPPLKCKILYLFRVKIRENIIIQCAIGWNVDIFFYRTEQGK